MTNKKLIFLKVKNERPAWEKSSHETRKVSLEFTIRKGYEGAFVEALSEILEDKMRHVLKRPKFFGIEKGA